MDEQILAAVVAAIVGKVADGLTDAARAALHRIRRRAAADPVAGRVLAREGQEPGQGRAMVFVALRREAGLDPGFAAEVMALARQLPAPRQLPAGAGFWVDRRPELAELAGLVADESWRRVLLLTGLPGVGKTALAVRCAAACASLVPDGQLYLDLYQPGRPDRALHPGQALGRLLRSLGCVPERIPASVEEQAALWRSMTDGRRLLVLLDNATEVEPLRLLLPASRSCVVLVTSRTQLSALVADGARTVTVRPLAQQPGVELLERMVGDGRVGHDPGAAAALVRACAGLPRAITVAAAALATRPGRSVRQIVDGLATSAYHVPTQPLRSDGERALDSVLQDAYGQLPQQAARCYRLLALHPASGFTSHVAAAALAVPHDQAVAALDTLTEAHLVEELVDSRYRYPPSVRDHAAGLAATDPRTVQTPVRRMTRWYLAGALAAARVLTPYQTRLAEFRTGLPSASVELVNRGEALAWLETERANLVDLASLAAPWWPEDVYRLVYAMWPLFHLRRYHSDRWTVDQIGLSCAGQLRHRDYEAEMTCRAGWGSYDRGAFGDAQDAFQRSLDLSGDPTDPTQRKRRAEAHKGLGHVALAQHAPAVAMEHFQAGLQIYQELGQPRRIALSELDLGRGHLAQDQPELAITMLTQGIARFVDLDPPDPYNRALGWIALGRALSRMGQTGAARADLDRALAQMTQLGSPRGHALARLHIAELLIAGGNQDQQAAAHLDDALAIFEQLGDREADRARQLLAALPARDRRR